MAETRRRRPAAWVRVLNLGFFLAGVGALVWLIDDVGFDAMAVLLGSIGWWSIPILGTSLCEAALKARAVHVFMRPEQRMIGYPRVLAAQLAGQAINAVVPSGAAGEVAKATMLMGHAPRYRAVSSVLLYNLVSTLFSAGFLLVAILLFLGSGDLAPAVKRGLELAFLVIAGACLLFVWVAQRGAVRTFAQLLRGAHVISPQRRAWLSDRLRSFDDQMSLFRGGRTGSYRSGVAYVAAARVIGWADLWIIMLALDEARGLVFTLIAAAAGMLVGSLASLVPLGAGVAEGGQAGLFAALGAGASVGLAIALVRRVRSLAMAALGLTVMLAVQLYDQLTLARSKAAVRERSGG